MTTQAVFNALQYALEIERCLESEQEPVEVTITLRGTLVHVLMVLIYREGWHKMLRYKLALMALRWIR